MSNIISHPGDGTAEVDFEPIVLASKEHHTLLEINNSSLNPVRKKLTAGIITSRSCAYARNTRFL